MTIGISIVEPDAVAKNDFESTQDPRVFICPESDKVMIIDSDLNHAIEIEIK